MISISAPSFAFSIDDCTLNGESVSLSNGATTAGKTGIIICKDRETGKMTREREIKAGKIFGLARHYQDGVLSLEYTDLENGQRNGITRHYAPNQQLIQEETEVMGKVKGLQREWYADGHLKKVEWIAEDRPSASVRYTQKSALNSLSCSNKALLAPHVDDASLCGFKGKAVTNLYFNDEGQKRASETLLAGVVQQATNFDTRTGQVRSSMELKGKEMTETSFFENGNKQFQNVTNIEEKTRAFVRKSVFYESGSIKQEQKFTMLEIEGKRRNFMNTETQFYQNGQMRSQQIFSKDGSSYFKEVLAFNDKGGLVSQAQYQELGRYDYRPIGIHKNFFEDGKVGQENHYDKNGKLFRQKRWDESGELISDEEVFDDGSRKAFSK
jgi:antitoxin component YwqK of YwqJK toxin-antitoxin module